MRAIKLNRGIFALFSCTFLMYFFFMPYVFLDFLYSEFSDYSVTTVSLIVTLPSLIFFFLSLIMGPIITKIPKKILILLGVIISFVGGFAVVLTGGHSLQALIMCSVCGGISWGILSNTSNAFFADIVMQDQLADVMGLNSSVGDVGCAIITALAGVICASMGWEKTYYLYFLAIPVILFAFFALPYPKKQMHLDAETNNNEMRTEKQGGTILGLTILALSLLLFAIAGSIFNLNYSSYIMTEFSLGDAAFTGICGTVITVGSIVGGITVGFISNKLKKYTMLFCCIFEGVLLALSAIIHSSSVLFMVILFLFGFDAVLGLIFCMSLAPTALKNTGIAICIVSASNALSSFIGSYLVEGINSVIGGTFVGKFWIGVVICGISAILAVVAVNVIERNKVQEVHL